jgi:hypothetical protein
LGSGGVSPLDLYRAIARRHATPDAGTWLAAALGRLVPPLDRGGFGALLAAAGRRLGDGPVALTPADRAALAAAELAALEGLLLADVARIALLLAAVDCLAPPEQAAFVDRIYRRGAGRERHAVLAALPALPDASRFVETAVEACRTNVRSEFEAIACENPYPARFLAEAQFNQLVLKALFIGVPLRRIVGLEARVGPELRRMVEAFARERRAAGRPVPDDVALVGLSGSPRDARGPE